MTTIPRRGGYETSKVTLMDSDNRETEALGGRCYDLDVFFSEKMATFLEGNVTIIFFLHKWLLFVYKCVSIFSSEKF
jgi:hypothetical protein